MRTVDYYAVLEIGESATQEEIRHAFRLLAKKYHPDRNPGTPSAEVRFKRIAAAYDILSDPEIRGRYDSQRSRIRSRSAQVPGTQDRAKPSEGIRPAAKPGAGAQDFLVVQCPNAACGKRLRVRSVHAKAQIRCPSCGTRLTMQVAVDLGLNDKTGRCVELDLVRIPAGSFMMGSDKGPIDGKPVHRVTFAKPFHISKYAITQLQWDTVTGSNPSRFPCARNPVERVSWNMCQGFLKKLNDKTGRKFTLPSEAEWEYACRAGGTTEYCFGDDASRLGEYAWYRSNSEDYATHPVGEKKPNAWGLHDMHGNVREWCEDVYHRSYEGAPADGSAWLRGGATGFRIMRGGSGVSDPESCRAAYRDIGSPKAVDHNIGCRVVLRDC